MSYRIEYKLPNGDWTKTNMVSERDQNIYLGTPGNFVHLGKKLGKEHGVNPSGISFRIIDERNGGVTLNVKGTDTPNPYPVSAALKVIKKRVIARLNKQE